MNFDVNDYVSKYLLIHSQMRHCWEDYKKISTPKHNRAVDKMIKLKEELHKDPQLSSSVYEILLQNENMYVRRSAAVRCIIWKINIDIAVAVLENILLSGDWESMTIAKTYLLINEGVIPMNTGLPDEYWDELRKLKASIDAQKEAQ